MLRIRQPGQLRVPIVEESVTLILKLTDSYVVSYTSEKVLLAELISLRWIW